MKTGNKILKCWEFYNCGKKECPSYHSTDFACWLQCGTHCHDEIQGKWLEKMELCIKCEVFRNNYSFKDWESTIKLIAEQFKKYNEKIEEDHKTLKETQKKLQEFKLTSIYLLKEIEKKNEEIFQDKNNLEKRVEEKTKDLNLTQVKLAQATKIASLGRLSAGIAHEINNPLGAIINYIRLILANPEIKGQNKGYLELTLKGLFRIENIVRQILGYAGQQKSEPKPTNINQLIKDTVYFMQHKLSEQEIKLSFKPPGSLPFVLIDPAQIQQVFINIINNAIDALDRGGTLTIEASMQAEEVHVRFIDNGKGIKTEELNNIFEPFYTTKEVGKGTGLGLFISYNIIQMYHGTIDIKSREGEGTTVTVILPSKAA